MKIKAIITGVTGMVGEGVLLECISHPEVEQILILTRKPSGFNHPKVKEIIHQNFHDLTAIGSSLSGYNACFFCLGVSSVGMKEPEYKRLTYDLTLHVAKTLVEFNSEMTFCYISGAGTDSTESGKSMWATVKGKTENDLLKLPFKKAYMFRPGVIQATPGQRNILKFYKYMGWLMPIIKFTLPNYISTMKQLGSAMIHAVANGYEKNVIEVKDIRILAGR
jgi:hypothetical protein